MVPGRTVDLASSPDTLTLEAPMAASHVVGLVRNRDRDRRDAGAAPRRGRARKPEVEGLEPRRLLSLAASPPIDEFPVPTTGGTPAGIATGPDGAVWFTEQAANRIGRITAGSLTDYPVLTPSSGLDAIVAGPDGNLWFTESSVDKIGQINPTTHVVMEYSVTAGSYPRGIAVGPDGALWFTEEDANKIGRMTTAGVLTNEFPISATSSSPYGITAGPDGALWFTEYNGNQIGRITTAGVVTKEYSPLAANSYPRGITVGPDGALWFAELGTNRIGRITTAGAVTELSIPSGSSAYGIAAGPDGALWFTEYASGKVGRITPAGTVTELSTPTASSNPELITTGPDHNLWFTEVSSNKIGRVDLTGYRPAEAPIPSTNSNPREIAMGPDGALWFTEEVANKIGRITTAGTITEYPIPTAGSFPLGIVAGPDGALWFTELEKNQIGRITTAGVVTNEFGIPFAGAPAGITVGPDGALWFTDPHGNHIGQITTDGYVTEYSITAGSGPVGIAAGPDGALWFTELGANRIGRITTAGVVTNEFPIPIDSSLPWGIVAGPDGALWFTEKSANANKIGRITTAGVVTDEFTIPTAKSSPEGIAVGPDGALWFTEDRVNQIGRITTAGAVIELPIPSGGGFYGIAAGPDRALWFTDDGGNKVGRIALPSGAVGGLGAVGADPNPTEGIPFSGVVATFAYPDPAATPSDFAATIVWGDGTITPGQVSREATGDFVVSGDHAYARGGQSYPVSVAVLDPDSRMILASVTANVAAAPLEAAGAPIAAVEGDAVPLGTPLATFSDTGGAEPLSAYSATVAWGDHSFSSPAVVQATGAGFQVVSAALHTYTDEGTYSVQVTITEANAAGTIINTTFASGAVTVTDALLAAAAVPPLAPPKSTPLVGATVASFTDANVTASAGDFTAMIDWGDGTTASLGVVSQPGGAGMPFLVTGNHTYAVDRALPYPITVSIHDSGGAAVMSGTQATVFDTAPIVSGIPVKMTKKLLFSAPVAYIVEVPGAATEPASHYTATIDWGDQSAATTGTVEAIPGGAWVVGTHTYDQSGPYNVQVTVTDDGGAVVTATTTAFDPPANPPGPVHRSPVPVGASPSTPVIVPVGPRQHGRKSSHHQGHPRRVAPAASHTHRQAAVAQAIGMRHPRRTGMRNSPA
jgi:streptogramin lyase/PKD repeat protein